MTNNGACCDSGRTPAGRYWAAVFFPAQHTETWYEFEYVNFPNYKGTLELGSWVQKGSATGRQASQFDYLCFNPAGDAPKSECPAVLPPPLKRTSTISPSLP